MKILIVVLLLAVAAFAYGVTCPTHDYASCYFNGQTRTMNGQIWQQYNCSCGDQVWVRQ